MNKRRQMLGMAVIGIGLLLAHNSRADFELLDLIDSSDLVALVAISSSDSHRAPINIEGKTKEESWKCHFTYKGTVEDVLKGSLPSELTFSSTSGLVTGGDYILFLDNERQPGTKVPFADKRGGPTCPELAPPVASYAMEADLSPRPKQMAIKTYMDYDGKLHASVPLEGYVRHDPLDLALPDEVESSVYTHYWKCSLESIDADDYESGCEVYKAESFINQSELVKYIKNSIQQ